MTRFFRSCLFPTSLGWLPCFVPVFLRYSLFPTSPARFYFIRAIFAALCFIKDIHAALCFLTDISAALCFLTYIRAALCFLTDICAALRFLTDICTALCFIPVLIYDALSFLTTPCASPCFLPVLRCSLFPKSHLPNPCFLAVLRSFPFCYQPLCSSFLFSFCLLVLRASLFPTNCLYSFVFYQYFARYSQIFDVLAAYRGSATFRLKVPVDFMSSLENWVLKPTCLINSPSVFLIITVAPKDSILLQDR